MTKTICQGLAANRVALLGHADSMSDLLGMLTVNCDLQRVSKVCIRSYALYKTSIWELEEANELPRTTGIALDSSICFQGVHAVLQL